MTSRRLWIGLLFVGGLGAYVAATWGPTPVTPPVQAPAAPAAPPAEPAMLPPVTALPPVPAPAPPSEGEVLTQLRLIVEPRPAAALALCEDAERRFPQGRTSDERALIKMKALVNLNRIADARVEATTFFEQHPQSPFAEQVFRLTGMHPTPRPPVP